MEVTRRIYHRLNLTSYFTVSNSSYEIRRNLQNPVEFNTVDIVDKETF